MLPYPPNAIGLEVAFVFFYAIIEAVRLHFGEGPTVAARAARPCARRPTITAHPARVQPWQAPLRALRWRRGRAARCNLLTTRAASSHPRRPHPRRAATKGNLLELVGPTLFSLLLSAPVIVFHAYMVQLQTYVLRLDQVINAIALAGVGVQVALGLAAALTFWRAQRY
jgi:hypothetical protein